MGKKEEEGVERGEGVEIIVVTAAFTFGSLLPSTNDQGFFSFLLFTPL